MSKTIPVKLNERESKAMDELEKTMGMSPEHILKTSFRLYQTIQVKIQNGEITQKDINAFLKRDKFPKKLKKPE